MSVWSHEELLRHKQDAAEHYRQEMQAKAIQLRKARTARAEMGQGFTAREKEELGLKLQKAMQQGDVEPWRLSLFDRDPLAAISGISPHVNHTYNFPVFEVLSKSSGNPNGFLHTGMSREEISARLREACERGALHVRALSDFDVKPEQTLRAIPERVAKAFAIPRPGTEPLSKSPRLRDVNINDFVREAKQAGLWP